MSGFVGYFAQQPAASADLLARLMAANPAPLGHEVHGTLALDNLGGAIGWSHRTDADLVSWPAWNPTRDCCLVFAGEHYSAHAGFGSPKAPSDAQEVLRCYDEEGAECLATLNGWFCGLLVDFREQKAILFNDRYGLSRVYIHESAGAVYFASEAKMLLRVFPNLRTLDPQSLSEWYSCGCVLQDRTLFPGIKLLPGSSAWAFRPGGRIDRGRYFDPDGWEEQTPLSLVEYAARTGEILDRILPRYFAGPESIALSLTGGVDSRMIMAGLPRGRLRLPCYTFGGMYRECADVRIARQIAQALDLPYRAIPLTPDFFARFPELARETICRTDGTMDVSGAVGLFVNALAREVAPIRMTGNYGGEILRGLVHFKPTAHPPAFLHPDLATNLRSAAATYAEERRCHPATFIAFKQVPWHHYARFALEQSVLTVRTPFLDNELVKLSFRAPPEAHVDKFPATQFIQQRSSALAAIPTDRGIAARLTWLPAKTRRFFMEILPRAEYLYDYGMPRWLAQIDRCLEPLHIERLFLGRQKYSHFRVWYRRELASFVQEVLLDPVTLSRSYLQRSTVEAMVRDHTCGSANHTTAIHKLLSLELIERYLLRSA